MTNSTPTPFSLLVSGSGCGTAVTSLTRQLSADTIPSPKDDQSRGFDRGAQTAKATKIVPSPHGDRLVGRGDRLACRPLRCSGGEAGG